MKKEIEASLDKIEIRLEEIRRIINLINKIFSIIELSYQQEVIDELNIVIDTLNEQKSNISTICVQLNVSIQGEILILNEKISSLQEEINNLHLEMISLNEKSDPTDDDYKRAKELEAKIPILKKEFEPFQIDITKIMERYETINSLVAEINS